MRPIYSQYDHLRPEHVRYTRTEDEASLDLGAYRMPAPANDKTQLEDAANLYRRIRDEADRAHRDVLARIEFLDRQEKQRQLAHATQQTAPETGVMFRRPCQCGNSTDTRLVHRFNGPCHPAVQDGQPCPTCSGNGCPDCSASGLAALNTTQLMPAEVYQFPQTPVAPQGPPAPPAPPAPAPAN
ncbi:hypothetical protein AB0K21_21775 [Streptosporangium sp. NPDC049248]|uniref:hypothetical protein n=1 Tax=Streptosporangium sp. NPDC049248 TaxID=3155651 RepID=UPI003440FFC9